MELEIAASPRNNVKPTILKWLVAAGSSKYLRNDGNYQRRASELRWELSSKRGAL
ncbi:hypothetical protein RHGRI_033398 [Rhododendron griersonianum]|uniref:Uncharacterized protein n=1 Tax=Rhododendron griersonianum TaxID=479676 RepID=A0AAV6HZ65_9ERIC|nr:hypothetical protein RHGRI_033398 [Rhododendron griersonianum]